MCFRCEKLIKCPNGEKRHIDLFSVKNDEGDRSVVTMVLDRAGNDGAFIATEIVMGGKYANLPFDISHCPFCGEKLKGE